MKTIKLLSELLGKYTNALNWLKTIGIKTKGRYEDYLKEIKEKEQHFVNDKGILKSEYLTSSRNWWQRVKNYLLLK
ncbi:MAG TPA: hypothetical protein VKO63_05295 [Chitinispirillaceae bacterium]|nr:hypothetical protein [Chitinispirillaceae bacterium]